MLKPNRVFRAAAASSLCLFLSGFIVDVIRYNYIAPSIENAENTVQKARTGHEWAYWRDVTIDGKASSAGMIGAHTVLMCAENTEQPSSLNSAYVDGELLCGRYSPPRDPNRKITGQEGRGDSMCFPLDSLTHIGRPYKSIAFGWYPVPIFKSCPHSRRADVYERRR